MQGLQKKQIKLDVDKEKKGDREMVRYEGLHWKIVQGQENEEKMQKIKNGPMWKSKVGEH